MSRDRSIAFSYLVLFFPCHRQSLRQTSEVGRIVSSIGDEGVEIALFRIASLVQNALLRLRLSSKSSSVLRCTSWYRCSPLSVSCVVSINAPVQLQILLQLKLLTQTQHISRMVQVPASCSTKVQQPHCTLHALQLQTAPTRIVGLGSEHRLALRRHLNPHPPRHPSDPYALSNSS